MGRARKKRKAAGGGETISIALSGGDLVRLTSERTRKIADLAWRIREQEGSRRGDEVETQRMAKVMPD